MKKMAAIGTGIALAVGSALAYALPSLRRYLKIEKM
jgi:hypothetical protein